MPFIECQYEHDKSHVHNREYLQSDTAFQLSKGLWRKLLENDDNEVLASSNARGFTVFLFAGVD